MQVSDLMPGIFTKLGEYFKKHPNEEMAKTAKAITILAAVQLTVAGLMFFLFKKMHELDEKEGDKGQIPKENLAVCTCSVISPGATTLARQWKLLKTGYGSLKDGIGQQNRMKTLSGLALMIGTYFVTTNL